MFFWKQILSQTVMMMNDDDASESWSELKWEQLSNHKVKKTQVYHLSPNLRFMDLKILHEDSGFSPNKAVDLFSSSPGSASRSPGLIPATNPTVPETNSSPLKINTWRMKNYSFGISSSIVSGVRLISRKVYFGILFVWFFLKPKIGPVQFWGKVCFVQYRNLISVQQVSEISSPHQLWDPMILRVHQIRWTTCEAGPQTKRSSSNQPFSGAFAVRFRDGSTSHMFFFFKFARSKDIYIYINTVLIPSGKLT